ncbi:hypothetical protein K502DRAFT_119110 [Neoconidiobolus thromboides FSU 785]|nr:hypothetical protein K502DRAFT_119110 [Neoconidiobolus thromboides FSU 785]
MIDVSTQTISLNNNEFVDLLKLNDTNNSLLIDNNKQGERNDFNNDNQLNNKLECKQMETIINNKYSSNEIQDKITNINLIKDNEHNEFASNNNNQSSNNQTDSKAKNKHNNETNNMDNELNEIKQDFNNHKTVIDSNNSESIDTLDLQNKEDKENAINKVNRNSNKLRFNSEEIGMDQPERIAPSIIKTELIKDNNLVEINKNINPKALDEDKLNEFDKPVPNNSHDNLIQTNQFNKSEVLIEYKPTELNMSYILNIIKNLKESNTQEDQIQFNIIKNTIDCVETNNNLPSVNETSLISLNNKNKNRSSSRNSIQKLQLSDSNLEANRETSPLIKAGPSNIFSPTHAELPNTVPLPFPITSPENQINNPDKIKTLNSINNNNHKMIKEDYQRKDAFNNLIAVEQYEPLMLGVITGGIEHQDDVKVNDKDNSIQRPKVEYPTSKGQINVQDNLKSDKLDNVKEISYSHKEIEVLSPSKQDPSVQEIRIEDPILRERTDVEDNIKFNKLNSTTNDAKVSVCSHKESEVFNSSKQDNSVQETIVNGGISTGKDNIKADRLENSVENSNKSSYYYKENEISNLSHGTENNYNKSELELQNINSSIPFSSKEQLLQTNEVESNNSKSIIKQEFDSLMTDEEIDNMYKIIKGETIDSMISPSSVKSNDLLVDKVILGLIINAEEKVDLALKKRAGIKLDDVEELKLCLKEVKLAFKSRHEVVKKPSKSEYRSKSNSFNGQSRPPSIHDYSLDIKPFQPIVTVGENENENENSIKNSIVTMEESTSSVIPYSTIEKKNNSSNPNLTNSYTNLNEPRIVGLRSQSRPISPIMHHKTSLLGVNENKSISFSARSGISLTADPAVVSGLNKAMDGEYLNKFVKSGLGSMMYHRRFFWINPYTKVLAWSKTPPKADYSGPYRQVYALSVTEIFDDYQCAYIKDQLDRSLQITTSTRRVIVKADSIKKHELWYTALKFITTHEKDVQYQDKIEKSWDLDKANSAFFQGTVKEEGPTLSAPHTGSDRNRLSKIIDKMNFGSSSRRSKSTSRPEIPDFSQEEQRRSNNPTPIPQMRSQSQNVGERPGL